MPVVRVSAHIGAPADAVFAAITDLAALPDTIPNVVAVEFLTEQRTGAGTRFKETRLMNGKEHVTELEVVEQDDAARTARMVSDMHGTVWDTRIQVSPADGGSLAEFAMDCRGKGVVQKVMNVLMQGMFRKGMQAHLDAFKTACEAEA